MGTKPVLKELERGTYSWCRCGRSATMPFCDGSHEGTSIAPLEFRVKEKKKIALCTCGRTTNAPLCDGSHAKAKH